MLQILTPSLFEAKKKKFRWIGHTLRKEDGEIPKAVLLWNRQGNRKRGRPRNSWRRGKDS